MVESKYRYIHKKTWCNVHQVFLFQTTSSSLDTRPSVPVSLVTSSLVTITPHNFKGDFNIYFLVESDFERGKYPLP